MDFDRCTGYFSNHQRVIRTDTIGVGGVAVSPNSRYVYISAQHSIFQYDLIADDFENSVVKVATNEEFWFKNPVFTYEFRNAHLAPNGRIYLSSVGGFRHYHTIHQPNKAGVACDVRQHDLLLPSWSFRGLATPPQFRLGPIDGSPCDTLGIDNVPFAEFAWEADQLAVQFTDNSWYETETRQWDFGDGSTSTQLNPAHTYAQPGIYPVCLIAGNANGSDTTCHNVAVSTLQAHFSWQADEQEPTTLHFTDQSGPTEVIDWHWNFEYGEFSALPNPEHTFTQAAPTEVCLTATDDFTSHTYCDTVFTITTATFQPDTDQLDLLVYPNPATEVITVQFSEVPAAGVVLELYDAHGRRALRLPVEPGSSRQRFSIATLLPGFYLGRVVERGTVQRGFKLVVL